MNLTDTVEVIRCKDCKYHDDGWCFGLPSIEVEPDDFCCWGERKDSE